MFKDSYTLGELYEGVRSNKIVLPNIQRSFVWRPHQIEDLWDSILRNYPIGSIAMHKRDDKYELLDGQQRITAICLGMYDRNSDDDMVLKASCENYRIFIDLCKPAENDSRKYIFRVITKSQPWGYQRSDNTKVLESGERRKALVEFNEKIKKETLEKEYYKMDVGYFYPYDAILPIPWDLFMTVDDIGTLKSEIKEWLEKTWNGQKRIESKINEVNKKIEKAKSNKDTKSQTKDCLQTLAEKGITQIDEIIKLIEDGHKAHDYGFYTIEELFNLAKHVKNDYKIPALYLDVGELIKDGKEDIENLFIRLNTAGTPLTREELNYSVLKENIDNKLQERIENECSKLLIKPSRFIAIAYSLWKKQEFSPNSIKPKVFQKDIQSKIDEFKKFIDELLNNNIIEQVEKILLYDKKNNKYGLPFILAAKILNSCPEILYVLLYRLHYKKDNFKANSDLHRKMLGIVTICRWLGKGERHKSYSKFLENIYPAMKALEQERFWSWETIQRGLIGIWGENVFDINIPESKKLIKGLNALLESKYRKMERKDLPMKLEKKNKKLKAEDVKKLLDNLFFNKELILYAQRKFLEESFDRTFFQLDDTNVPFDWDHIFPQSFIDKRIEKTIRDWYNSNGNFRAWPYELNRGDQDIPPYEKLKDKKIIEDSFCGCWSKKDLEDLNKIEIKQHLKNNWKTVFNLIMKRNIALYKEWVDSFEIDDLIKFRNNNIKTIKKMFEKFLWKGWTFDDKNKDYDYDCVYKFTLSQSKEIELYIAFNNDEILLEEGIEVGIKEITNEKDKSILKELYKKLPEKDYELYEDKEDVYIYKYFTLISTSKEAIKDLLRNISDWLQKIYDNISNQNPDLKKALKDVLSNLNKALQK